MTGTTLSHYRIVSELGKGGMGVVYKAEDTKLDRTVALKLLAPHMLASDADRSRFYREARAAAALHHPNIATVFEIDETGDGRPFIAMEYIDGRQLDEGLSERPLPVEEAVRIATQIAEALKAAHEQDIVHRDVKSANVMLTKDGVAKVLDFGLAKTNASTKLTQMGSTVGTIAYMSPEQARGEEVDSRTDLWSLGAVLYEMLTGQLPFPGSYEQAVVYGILNADAEPVTSLRTGVPVALEQLVEKCLRKDASHRYQSAAGLLADLKSLDLAGSGVSRRSVTAATATTDDRATAATPRWVWLGMAAAMVIGALVAWLAKPPPAPEAHPMVHFSIETEPHGYPGRRSIAITPDGATVAQVTPQGLVLRSMNDLARSNPVPGLPALREVFTSPDSEWLGFENIDDELLMRVRLTGGAPVPVTALPQGLSSGATWSEDGYIYMGLGEQGLARVPESGGTFEMLTPDSLLDGSGYRTPEMLPDGKTLLYTRRPRGESWNDAEIRLMDLDGTDDRLLHAGGSDAQYLESGHIAFVWRGTLYAFAFDAERGQKMGGHFPFGGAVFVHFGRSHFDVSQNGTLVKIPAAAGGGEVQLAWLEPDGSETPVSPDFGTYQFPAVHPDGLQVAFDADGGIRLLDAARRTSDALVGGWSPVWSREGDRLAFSRGRSIMVMRPAVSLEMDTLWTSTSRDPGVTSWSPNGRFLVFTQWDDAGNMSIHTLDLESGTAAPFMGTTGGGGVISPDGWWIAYESDESGNDEVYVRRFPGGEQVLKVSQGGGEAPQWRPDGGAIYFRLDDRPTLAMVEINPDAGEIGTTRILLEGRLATGGSGFSINPQDGRPLLRLLSTPVDEAASTPRMEIAVHWTDEVLAATPDH